MFQKKQKILINSLSIIQKKRLSTVLALVVLSNASVIAQENTTDAIEEVVVTGTRATIQNSIDIKRQATQIVDGLSAEDIGDIPAISIGDALETITGAASHRENGGATEISIRGLGPFLSTTVVNDREATNGGGNRAVNFSIFPSEMFNKVAIHKTQSAEYIEGAVSGQIHLDTRKPIEYGKRLLQVNLKGAYSPDEHNIDGGQDFGGRATLGYIDQFEFDNGSAVGISLGVQIRDESNPEQEYMTTSGAGRLEACELSSFSSDALPTDTSGRCHDGDADVSNNEIQTLIDDNPDYNSVEDIPFAYIPRDHRYRQNTSNDEREAIFSNIQWQPNDRLDINVDYQYSVRDQRELRKDLQFGSTQEDITLLTSNPFTGLVSSSVSRSNIFSFTTDFQRLEKYQGFGLNINYQLTDNLKLNVDYGFSDTQRTETDVELRLGATDNSLVAGDGDDFTLQLDVNSGQGAGIATLLDVGNNGFEVTDPSYFNARNRARIRARQIIRDNTLDAFRADLEWSRSSIIHTVKTGIRYSSLEYFTRGGDRDKRGESLFEAQDLVTPEGGADNEVTDAILSNVIACADPRFPESDFLSNVRSTNLITNAVSDTRVNSYATFNYNCAVDSFLENYGGISGIKFQNGITLGTNDVTEDTTAFYLQADYEYELVGYPIRGNFGVRVVDTNITSIGYRNPISVEESVNDAGSTTFVLSSGEGFDETATQKSGYTEFLPSVTLIGDLSDDLVLRAGLFRGLSRPDPNAYGNGRDIRTGDNNVYDDLSAAVNAIPATGNPFLKPILSTNLDLGLEWYANIDTILALALYWKKFNGAFETVSQLETFNLDGTLVEGAIVTTQTSDDTSTIKGFELTASHAFDYLPGILRGLGIKFSYNYADSDFEFEDQHGGDGIEIAIDNVTGAVTESQLIGIIPPANLFGLSKNVSSTQLYWDYDKYNVQVIYKTRSQYFQQFTRDTTGRIRYTASNQTLDLRARYKINSKVSLSLEAKNILDEPRIDYRAIEGNILQALSYGPRIFFGVRAKF